MLRRLALALSIVAVVAGVGLLAGCGADEESTDVSEGEIMQLGDLQYNVVISRFLNPDDTEDADYLVDQPPLEGDQLYFGIFMQVSNEGGSDATLPSDFKVTDTEGNVYKPIPSKSPYALPLGDPIPADESYPVADSTAAVGPIEGSMVLFRITQASTEDRPLDLEIPSSAGEPGTVELDI